MFLIAVALLQNTNFFRAFTAFSMIHAIYVQQFWDTMCFNTSTGLYSCQLDEQWFNLHKDLLRDVLDITPTNDNNPFVAPPSSDTVIEYVNTLGYPSTLRNMSVMSVNALHQPWRAILSMINMCLTGKTVGYYRPRHPVLQILWGIIHSSNIDYAERIWERFVQSIQTFLADRKNFVTASRRKKKTAHLLISSVRFTKLIIHHLKTKYNIHPRSGSPLHYSLDESVLNTLRYVGKDGRESFVCRYLMLYLLMKLKENPTTANNRSMLLSIKNIWMLNMERLQNEELQSLLKLPREPDSGRIQPLRETPKNKIPLDQFIFQRHTPMPAEASGPAESPSLDAKLAMTDSEIESDDVVPKINIGDQDEGQAGPNPGIQDEGQAGPNTGEQDEGQAGSNPGDAAGSQPQPSHVVPARPNLKPIDLKAIDAVTLQTFEQIDKEFTITAYQSVQENLKLPSEEKEEDPGKTNAEAKVRSMVLVPIHQDTSSVPLMTTLTINLTLSQSAAPLPTSTATTSAAIQAPLRARFSDLPTVDMKEILQQRMFESKSYEAHEDHKKLYDALEKSLERDYSNQLLSDLDEARQKKRKRLDVPITPSVSPPPQPPPPPPSARASGALGTSGALGSSQLPPPPSPL
nr:hypothetical protein [Tanacetum cinerariifolium]